MIVSYLVEEIIHQEWLGRGDVLRKMNFFLLLAKVRTKLSPQPFLEVWRESIRPAYGALDEGF